MPQNKVTLAKIIEKIELPEVAYQKAEERYNNVGEWFRREESSCLKYEPFISPQGSFRLGTAVLPENDKEYDLDLTCNLTEGLSKSNVTQKYLKELVGNELSLYRKALSLKQPLQEKRRCWRLEYKDDLSFHMDIVPSIPEADIERNLLRQSMVNVSRFSETLAASVSDLAISITDNEDPNYYLVSSDWRLSNPEGYAKWFESRMRMSKQYITERELHCNAKIDELPYFQWKTPLQRAVQLLKRHRDVMYRGDDEDSKPISIIITTLAAKAYSGEASVPDALLNILTSMASLVNNSVPHVANPVNPSEDFADKWYSPKHAHLHLKEHFYRWLIQAQADFETICNGKIPQNVADASDRGLDVKLDKTQIGSASTKLATPTIIGSSQSEPPKPWFRMHD